MPEQEPHVGQPYCSSSSKLLLVDFAGLIRADAFEYGRQRDRPAVGCLAGFHRAAADEHRRNVDAQRAHHHARRNFVAVRDADHAVKPVRINDRLHASRR